MLNRRSELLTGCRHATGADTRQARPTPRSNCTTKERHPLQDLSCLINEGYESIVRVRVVPRIGTKQLAKLSPLDLQSLYAELSRDGLTARGIGHTHRVLHRALSQAVRWELIARSPCDGVTPPRPRRTEMQVLTAAQANSFLTTHRDHPSLALWILALTTGMRQGELLGLRWSDIDLGSRRLTVQRALQRQREAGLVFVEPKTSRSRRTIALSAIAVNTLLIHQSQ